MMDEAFMPFQQIITRMLSFGGDLIDMEAGVRSYIYEYAIESPLELNIVTSEDGQLQIGLTPPLYYLDTSFRPSFHRIRFKADLQVSDGE